MKRIVFCIAVMLVCLPLLAQQTDINKYTFFTGFDYLTSPSQNLYARGVDFDFGYTAKPWLGVGADFGAFGSNFFSGTGTITGTQTIYAPLLLNTPGAPPPSSVHVPFSTATYTFAVGGQLYLRKFKKVTFLVRPGLGMIHDKANLNLPPQLGGLLTLLHQPVPSAKQTDTTWFIGFGGGFDVNMSKRVGMRFAFDWINTHLFSDLLVNRQNYFRLSVGPTFRWGQLRAAH